MRLTPLITKRLIISILSVIGVIGLFLAYLIGSIFYFSTIDQKRPADAAIVLGAAAWYKRPSPVFEERIRHGIWLYQNGYVSKLIMTGGKSLNAPFSEAFSIQFSAIRG